MNMKTGNGSNIFTGGLADVFFYSPVRFTASAERQFTRLSCCCMFVSGSLPENNPAKIVKPFGTLAVNLMNSQIRNELLSHQKTVIKPVVFLRQIKNESLHEKRKYFFKTRGWHYKLFVTSASATQLL